MLESIELFAGAGGLALGFADHHVAHRAVVEWNKYACQTLRHNKSENISPMNHWPDVTEGDVRNFNYEHYKNIDLVTGGPPCQPFSMGGKHGGFLDERDMFPQAIRAVREVRPRAFVFENVRGLTRAAFYNYFNYILLQFEFPDLLSKPGEEWLNHLARLERYKTQGGRSEYHIVTRLVNAANYGVPQKRFRVFIVGFHKSIGKPWTFPSGTHSEEMLLFSQWGNGEYWERHRVAKKSRPAKPDGIDNKIRLIKEANPSSLLLPWRTVRDAIFDLPDPEKSQGSLDIQAHKFQPGARSYPGHTGSPLDEPSIKSGRSRRAGRGEYAA
jgi:DNA (cytosine-5)-methyltransferase 1